jgi:hypothetical protein
MVKVRMDSIVGTATRYGLDGPGIESRRGRDFRTSPDWPWGPSSLLYNVYRVSLPGVKRPGCGVNHRPPSSAEIRERVELYLYSTSGPSWPVLGRTLPFRDKNSSSVYKQLQEGVKFHASAVLARRKTLIFSGYQCRGGSVVRQEVDVVTKTKDLLSGIEPASQSLSPLNSPGYQSDTDWLAEVAWFIDSDIIEVSQNTTSFSLLNKIEIETTCFNLNQIIFRLPTSYKTCSG